MIAGVNETGVWGADSLKMYSQTSRDTIPFKKRPPKSEDLLQSTGSYFELSHVYVYGNSTVSEEKEKENAD